MQAQHGPDQLNKSRAGSGEDRSVRPGSHQEPDPRRPAGHWRSTVLA